jgi:predicted GTPase
MEILPIRSNAKDELAAWQKKKNPIVFTKIPFTCLVYGSSGVGKSTAIANIFLRDFDSLT